MVGEKNPFLRIYEKNKIKLHSKIITKKQVKKAVLEKVGLEKL